MNQKKIFYLFSLIAIFFIGHYYSQFNISPVKPEIIIINNNDGIEEYKLDNLNLQQQLEELNNQLILALDELKSTSQKLNLSASKIQILEEELISIQNAFNLTDSSLKKSNAKLLENDKTFKELEKALSDAELDIELIKFDLEIAEANLRAH
jgi:peptidoglycan hydrolase CwlO-like protein